MHISLHGDVTNSSLFNIRFSIPKQSEVFVLIPQLQPHRLSPLFNYSVETFFPYITGNSANFFRTKTAECI